MIVVGLMSGTSADGIDTAIVEISGAPPHLIWKLLGHTTQPHPPPLRAEILACCDPRTATVDRICTLHAALGQAFGQAVLATIKQFGIAHTEIDLIGSHGQTIWHAPHATSPGTLQIGSAAEIAEITGIPVVCDFRSADIAAGGQGAPLVAAVDRLLLTHPTHTRVAQNIGGIGNLTYLPPDGEAVLAFDTGPGNLLLDAAMHRISAGKISFDAQGELAAQGMVHGALLEELLSHPFLGRIPPKTTGREDFGTAYAEEVMARAAALGLRAADLLATLTAFTAHSIVAAYRDFLPRMPDHMIISGGGARNTTLLRMLQAALAPIPVETSDLYGIPIEAKESLAFAVLAYETWHGRPGNLPSATGAVRPVVLGNVTGAERATAIIRRKILRRDTAPVRRDADTLPLTETRNPRTVQIDTLPTINMLRLINQEDATVAAAVATELPQIAAAVDAIVAAIQNGGRLIYAGAGTSGRLGALDAAECPPTFSTPPGLVVALIAGGSQALSNAVEGAEDDAEQGMRDLQALQVGSADVVVGIAASGNTPYVVGVLQAAQAIGAYTISLACSHPAAIAAHAQIAITPLVGPEVLTGSTRMKAGTAQKLVLNMLTTGTMIQLGKTYGNLMVDVQPTNAKLRKRALRIVCEATGLETQAASDLLARCQNDIKTAIVVALTGTSPAEAHRRLQHTGGRVHDAL